MASWWSNMMRPTISICMALLAFAIYLPTDVSASTVALDTPSAFEEVITCLQHSDVEECLQTVKNLEDQLCLNFGCAVCLGFTEDWNFDLGTFKISDVINPTLSGGVIVEWFGFGKTAATDILVPGKYQIRTAAYGEILCGGFVQ